MVTVLLINEGATQGELLQSKQGLTLGSIITPADSRARFTQSDYATLRKQGFSQLVAIAERDVTLSCNGSEPTATTLTLLGVDTQPLLGSALEREVLRRLPKTIALFHYPIYRKMRENLAKWKTSRRQQELYYAQILGSTSL